MTPKLGFTLERDSRQAHPVFHGEDCFVRSITGETMSKSDHRMHELCYAKRGRHDEDVGRDPSGRYQISRMASTLIPKSGAIRVAPAKTK